MILKSGLDDDHGSGQSLVIPLMLYQGIPVQRLAEIKCDGVKPGIINLNGTPAGIQKSVGIVIAIK